MKSALGTAVLAVTLVTGCQVLRPEPAPTGPDQGYCDALDLQLDAVDPRMAASARADMDRVGCPNPR